MGVTWFRRGLQNRWSMSRCSDLVNQLQINSCQRRQLCLGGLTAKLHDNCVCTVRNGVILYRLSFQGVSRGLGANFYASRVVRSPSVALLVRVAERCIKGRAKHVVASERRAHGRGFDSRHLHQIGLHRVFSQHKVADH